MATYFGETTPGGSVDTGRSTADCTRNFNKVYTCPGTGAQSLTELSIYCRSGGGTPGNVRLAIYDTTGNLIYQGAAEVSVSSTSPGWVGHTGITGVVLTGGTNYKLAASFDNADSQPYYNIETAGDYYSWTTDYTGGFPGTLTESGGVNEDYIRSIRAGVDPIVGLPTGVRALPQNETRKRFFDLKGWFSPLMVSQGWFWNWWQAGIEATIKTIFDSASASDALGIGVVLAIAESGQGSDAFGMGAELSLADAGSGADIVAQLLAQLALNDSGVGADVISQIAAQLVLNDAGAGTDVLAGIGVIVPVADTGTGLDSPSIAVTFVVQDSGAGSDSVSVIQAILIAVADAAAANDSLSVSANISTADTGQGTDAIVLSVNLSVSDSGSGTDSVAILMDVLKTVADIAQASDSVGPITVNLAVSDSGAGLDLLGALSVVAQVVDYASGLDIVIRIIGSETKTISITFIGKKPSITFSGKQPDISFMGKEASMLFSSNQPEILFSGRTAQIEFSSQGGMS